MAPSSLFPRRVALSVGAIATLLLGLTGCLEGTEGRPTGERCESAADCRDTLVCEYGRCRSECTVDRDCPEGSACVAVEGGSGERVCTVEVEQSCPEVACPEGLVCNLDEGVCREPCPEGSDCGEGRVCHDNVCVEEQSSVETLLGLAAGHSWTCAWYAPGGVRCWGDNGDGQLGDGTREDRLEPTPVAGLEDVDVVQVAAGGFHTCALLGDGTAWCWGDNISFQLGLRTASFALEPAEVAGVSGVEGIACGENHTCAVLGDGTAACWGRDDRGQLGDGGTLSLVDPVPFGAVDGVAGIAAAERHTCVFRGDGTASCAGWDFYGQLGDGAVDSGPGPVDVAGVGIVDGLAAQGRHTCSLLRDDSVACWGYNAYGQIGTGSTGDREPAPVNVTGLTGVAAIAVGNYHSCAAGLDGTVSCWGQNSFGQLGDGSRSPHYTPGEVPGLSGIVGVTAGFDHSCAWNAEGEAWCWGWNTFGQLGDGTTLDQHTPVPVLL